MPAQEWPHPSYGVARCSSPAAAGNQAASHPGCGEVQGSVFANPEKGVGVSFGALEAFTARQEHPVSFRHWLLLRRKEVSVDFEDTEAETKFAIKEDQESPPAAATARLRYGVLSE